MGQAPSFSRRGLRASDGTKAVNLSRKAESKTSSLASPSHLESGRGKQNADRRVSVHSASFSDAATRLASRPPPCGRGQEGARPPVGVPQRRLPEGRWSQRLSPGQASWDVAGTCDPKPAPTGERKPRAVSRALPAPACPSLVAAPHAPVVVPASMMPGTARERSVSLHPREPHPLHLREYLRERRPSTSGMGADIYNGDLKSTVW
jgi:hypothetical protein